MFALVDCNNFYVSCERVFRPELKGRPVVVLSNNDGCIIARSEEAKLLGLQMAEPAFKKVKLLERNGVHIFSSNYTLYGDMSDRVIETLSHFCPNLEIYSIDEVFLDLGNEPKNFQKFSEAIITRVEQNTGIPISVGIAQTKTLAKIANKMAKQTGGVFIIKNNRHCDSIIRNTPIEMVWGIGRQYAKLLVKNKITTAFDLTQADDSWLKSKMKVIGVRIKKELTGESCIPLELVIPAKKAIATTRAFGRKTSELKYIQQAVATYAVRCAEKLRKQNSVAHTLTVFIHTDPFNQREAQLNKSKTISLPVATNHNAELVKYALYIVNSLFQKEYKYKKAGVILDGLQHLSSVQRNMFDTVNRKKHQAVAQTLDKLNTEFGRDTIKLAIQGNGKEWQLRQERLSKRYTTRWDEIIEVKI